MSANAWCCSTPRTCRERCPPSTTVSAHVLHQYGSVLVVAVDDEDADEELAAALPGDARPLPADAITRAARRRLDETAALGIAALELRSSDDYLALKASRPLAGEPWDVAEATTPGCAEVVPADDGFAAEADGGRAAHQPAVVRQRRRRAR